MSTAIYNPFREMDRFFNQVAKTAGPDTRYMPLDLYRDGDQFVAKMDLPGVDPATIDIDVDEDIPSNEYSEIHKELGMDDDLEDEEEAEDDKPEDVRRK